MKQFKDCLGNRCIDIEIDSTDENENHLSRKGMMALFRSRLDTTDTARTEAESNHSNVNSNDASLISILEEDDTSVDSLHLVITDGVDTYHGRIGLHSIKLPTSMMTQNKFSWMTKILLHPNKDVNIKYVYTQVDEDNTEHIHIDRCVKVVIKQSIDKVVRYVYSGDLESIQNYNQHDKTTKTNRYQNDNVMTFIYSITNALQQSKFKNEHMELEKSELMKQLHSWQDTATKLDKSWQKEKEDTLNRYLVLLNHCKQDLRTAKNKLQDSQQKYNDLLRQTQETSDKSSGQSTGKVQDQEQEQKEAVIDYEDEHDIEIFDEDEINLLARGKRVYSSKNASKKEKRVEQNHTFSRQTSVTTEVTTSQSQPTSRPMSQHSQLTSAAYPSNSQTLSQSQSSRTNPHTGVVEMWSVDDLFHDEPDVGGGGAKEKTDANKFDDLSKNYTGVLRGTGESIALDRPVKKQKTI